MDTHSNAEADGKKNYLLSPVGTEAFLLASPYKLGSLRKVLTRRPTFASNNAFSVCFLRPANRFS